MIVEPAVIRDLFYQSSVRFSNVKNVFKNRISSWTGWKFGFVILAVGFTNFLLKLPIWLIFHYCLNFIIDIIIKLRENWKALYVNWLCTRMRMDPIRDHYRLVRLIKSRRHYPYSTYVRFGYLGKLGMPVTVSSTRQTCELKLESTVL